MNNLVITSSIFLIIVLLFGLKFSNTYANGSLILKSESINPGSFYYSFKRLWEKGMIYLQFSQEKRILFLSDQLKVRLSELNHVIENKLLGEVEGSSERFAYTAGILVNELTKEGKYQGKEKVKQDFSSMKNFLESLRDKYPANTSHWMLIQHDINTLNILSENLN